MISSIYDILSCPLCRIRFTLAERQLICRNGHAFDISSKGYVNLSFPVGRKQLDVDTPEMVQSRLAVQESDAFEPITTTLIDAAGSYMEKSPVVADFGSGPGYYLDRVVRSLGSSTRGVAIDISQAAVRHASKRHDKIGAVRANIRMQIPLCNNSIDLGLNIFAPRNMTEMSRVLKPDALLFIVIPTSSHLIELRERGLILNIEENKAEKLNKIMTSFCEIDSKSVHWQMEATDKLVADIVGMGPSAFHVNGHSAVQLPGLITCDVELRIYRNISK